MTRRRMLLLTISALLCTSIITVQANDVTPVDTSRLTVLSAVEIEKLLSGNTAIGEWSGTLYRQVFRANGSTIYLPEGTRDSLGEWRDNAGDVWLFQSPSPMRREHQPAALTRRAAAKAFSDAGNRINPAETESQHFQCGVPQGHVGHLISYSGYEDAHGAH